jgi:hypothetical protein
MADFEKKDWVSGETITEQELDRIEQGIEDTYCLFWMGV